MGNTSVKRLQKIKQLATNRQKRWPNQPTGSNIDPISPESPSKPHQISDSALHFANLSLSEQPCRILDQTQLEAPTPDENPPTEPPELDNPGIDPEDLPFEDPESVAEGSEDGICDNDGWWEGDPGADEADLGPEPENENYDVRVDNQPIPPEDQKVLIHKLDKIVKDSYRRHGTTRCSSLDEVTLSRIRMMTMSLRLSMGLECGLIKASTLAATAVGRAKWAAASARKWIWEFWRTGKLPGNLYGKWNHSIIEDEDFKHVLLEHLRCVGQYAGPKDIVAFFDTPEAEPFQHLLDEPPSLRTAQRWMPILGYKWKTERRGQFADGHEREDVVDYRMNHFIPKWLEFERRMRTWDSEGNEIPPNLAPGEKEVVAHFHDETIFKAHERRLTRWIHEAETAGLYKKGDGLSLMVAHMISAKYGFLQRSSFDGNENDTARVVFRPGKERDGYFVCEDVCVQTERSLQILTKEYSNEHHLLVFDNATTHKKFPDDTPVVSGMTLGPSDKVGGNAIGPSGEKIKVKFAPAKFADGSPQELYYPADHPRKDLRDAFKGLAKILEERGIPGARKLKLQCPTTKGRGGCPRGRTDCCARTTMANQPDILAQKTVLELLAESYGCSVLYLPKYHCELNPIEQVWGAAKRVYRDNPMSSSEADLIRNALSSLDSVKPESIRRHVNKD